MTQWTTACQAFLSFTISWNLLKFMSIELVMLSNHLMLCHPLLFLPSTFPSIRVFSNELALRIRWPKYWSFIFSISSSNEYSGLISFKIDLFDFLAGQGTQESSPVPQFESINFLVLSLFYGPTHIHTWLLEKLWWYRPLLAMWCLCFLKHCLDLSELFSQGARFFNFVAAITTSSEIGDQEN